VDFNKMFDKECEENYWDIVNFVTSHLMKTSKEYKNSAYRCSDIIEEYPNLYTRKETTDMCRLQKQLFSIKEKGTTKRK